MEDFGFFFKSEMSNITLKQMSLGGHPAFTAIGTFEQLLSSLVASNHSGKFEASFG